MPPPRTDPWLYQLHQCKFFPNVFIPLWGEKGGGGNWPGRVSQPAILLTKEDVHPWACESLGCSQGTKSWESRVAGTREDVDTGCPS